MGSLPFHRIRDPSVPLVDEVDSALDPGWPWAEELQHAPTVRVMLRITGHRMSIPKTKERCLVGRDTVIDEATEAILSVSGARVLIHGIPGAGKDVVAAETVLREEVSDNAQLTLQAWLQGSSDAGLRSQLVDLFDLHWPAVVRAASDQTERLKLIYAWLESHHRAWLFVVEDATWECTALWECFPPGAGRLLVTSQHLLHVSSSTSRFLATTHSIELGPVSTSDSVLLWEKMGVFTAPAADMGDGEAVEEQLRQQCAATTTDRFSVAYEEPPRKESTTQSAPHSKPS